MVGSKNGWTRVVVLVAIALSSAVASAHAKPPEVPEPLSPDIQINGIFSAIAADRLDDALRLDDELIEAHPNFRLAYLLRGDLLLARSQPIKPFGVHEGGSADRLDELREEAILRLRAYRDRPGPSMVPRYLLQMAPDQKIAVVVDAGNSRLYVYGNDGGKPRFLADYYITQGKDGVDKSKEGDMKTPIGVYHINGSIPRKKLNDFYGVGALPINYPNEWDRLNGRTGHGIWLHGTPSNTYSRAPKASDGCLVLSNPDLRALFQNVQIGMTPVIITEDVEWLKLDDWNAERTSLQHAIEAWRVDWESRDVNQYLAHYSRRFSSDSEALRQWSARKRQVNSGKEWVKVQLKNVSMLRYPGKDDLVVVTFEQDYRSNNMSNMVTKRQYWAKEGAHWKIVYEGVA